jgi:predicted Zn finger-like uncharacterized protein
MLIVCPSCTTSYQVTAASIGPTGRSVRCARCKNKWFVSPRAEEPNWESVAHNAAAADAEAAAGEIAAFKTELAQEESKEVPINEIPVIDDPSTITAEAQTAMAEVSVASDASNSGDPPAYANPFGDAALSEIVIPAGEAPPLVPEPGEAGIAPGAANSAEPKPRRRRPPAARKKEKLKLNPLPVILVILLCTVTALFVWRKDIVRRAPQMASLYRALGMDINLRGLVFSDIKVTNDIYDGVPVIIVEGTIVSQTNMAVDVPRIRFAVQNAAGHEVYTWTAVPSQPVLEPGARLPFKSRLASPPADAHNIAVRFFTRRDAMAGLR